MSISKRHHYIPQYFIKGFQSSEGYYYVYNKDTERIQRYNSSESIFFHWHGYSINETEDLIKPVNEYSRKTDIVEKYYRNKESIFAPLIASMRTRPITTEFVVDDIIGMEQFIVNQFCRTPYFDDYFNIINDKVIRDAEAKHGYNDGVIREMLENQTVNIFKKFMMPYDILQRMDEGAVKNRYMSLNVGLNQLTNTPFLLGDFPMVYCSPLKSMLEIMGREVIIPLSASRAYFVSERNNFILNSEKVSYLNSLIIYLSKKYVCGPDKEILQAYIDYYNILKSNAQFSKEKVMDFMRMMLFL